MNRSSYLGLPQRFYARVAPTRVAKPQLLAFNRPLAEELSLQLDGLDADELATLFSGNWCEFGARDQPGAHDQPGAYDQPIAMVYAGHQFGQFVPQLGDGRAILLGEATDLNGKRSDIQLKGAGRTPYSRGGDGRAALGPVLREYLVSEAMHALRIPTTRALAAVASGEPVYREEALPGAILTRVAASHVRVGTFEYFAARGDEEACRLLADYVIDRHYPAARSAAQPYRALLAAVAQAQASLIADWMSVGFIHGVMNTDNMAISGETIDFGPCAFMDVYDPATVFSSIDRHGRYAYENQPHAAAWNLARFAETLLPLIDAVPERAAELAGEDLAAFAGHFSQAWLTRMRRKLGLSMALDGDASLAEGLLVVMQRGHADFTLTFRALCKAALGEEGDAAVKAAFAEPQVYEEWAVRWRARLAKEPMLPAARAAMMNQANPAVVPRNHRIQQVIDAAIGESDLQPFAHMSSALAQPYAEQQGTYTEQPQPQERVLRTFCGT